MNDSNALRLAQAFKEEVQKGFGRKVCEELHLDCASCKAQSLIGHLNWYIDVLEPPELDARERSPRKRKPKRRAPS